jgi:diacylglycerol kinase family enzyme
VPPLDCLVDGVPVTVAGLIASKGRLYGGAFVCAPAGDLARDALEVVLFERRGRAALFRSSWGLVCGRLDRCPGVRIVRARRVEIRGPAGQPLQVDGDVLARTPAVVEVAPVTLDLVVP